MNKWDTLCDDCEFKELKYEYHFPHPEEWYWYCSALKTKLENHSGVRKDINCPYFGLAPQEGR